MISPMKLIKMARKWQKMAAIRRKRITLLTFESDDADRCSSSTPSMPEKGHFVVYSVDGRRFVLPLVDLNNKIIRGLAEEDQFGLPTNGPLRLPCDAAFMEYMLTLIREHAAENLEKALLMSIASGRLSSECLSQEQANQQLLINGL